MNSNTVRNLLWLFAFLLIAGLFVYSRINTVPQQHSNESATKNKVSDILWKTKADNLERCEFTSSGEFFTAIQTDGKVSLYHNSGTLKYSVKMPGVDRALVSPNGTMTLAYSYMDNDDTRLRFMDEMGVVVSTLDVRGAVWCADSWESAGVVRFAVGTGQRHVYCIEFDNGGRSYRRWRAPGAVVSVSFESSGDDLVYGTWQRSFILRSTRRGTLYWSHPIKYSSLPYVDSVADGDMMSLLEVPNRKDSDISLKMVDNDGRNIWQTKLSAKNHSRALMSLSAKYTCVGYEQQIEHSGKSITEEHAILLDEYGDKVWDKGSLFLRLHPIAVTDDGCVLAAGQQGRMHIVDQKGNVTASAVLNSDMEWSVWSPEASRILLYTSDGWLYMLGLSDKK